MWPLWDGAEPALPAGGFEDPAGFAFCGQCGTPLTPPIPPAHATSFAARPQPLQAYTPRHLAEKILTSKTALEGERKQGTVLFAGPSITEKPGVLSRGV